MDSADNMYHMCTASYGNWQKLNTVHFKDFFLVVIVAPWVILNFLAHHVLFVCDVLPNLKGKFSQKWHFCNFSWFTWPHVLLHSVYMHKFSSVGRNPIWFADSEISIYLIHIFVCIRITYIAKISAHPEPEKATVIMSPELPWV